MKKNSFSLFTLIELLIVIFIILVLFSFIVPVQKSLQLKTKNIMCKGNLRQIGILTINYTMDHDGYLPNNGIKDSHQKHYDGASMIPKWQQGWHGRLAPYVWEPPEGFVVSTTNSVINNTFKTSEMDPHYYNGGKGYQGLGVFWCPQLSDEVDAIKEARGQGSERPSMSYYDLPTSYTAVGTFLGTFGANTSNPQYHPVYPFKLESIERPETTIYIFEGMGSSSTCGSSADIIPTFLIGNIRHKIKKNLAHSAYHRLNFIHDDIEEFWAIDYYNGYKAGWYGGGLFDLMNKIVETEGTDKMVACNYSSGWIQLISYKEPKFLQDTYTDGTYTTTVPDSWEYFGYGYEHLTGNMNSLYADMHVSKVTDMEFYLSWWNDSKAYVGNHGNFQKYD